MRRRRARTLVPTATQELAVRHGTSIVLIALSAIIIIAAVVQLLQATSL